MFGLKKRLKPLLMQILSDQLERPVGSPYEPIFEQYGHPCSTKTKHPIAADGSPLPWYTYPAIEYCNQMDASGLHIFEYGSGNSSLYWARKGGKVWCVEHDAAWYETMKSKSAQLCGISLCHDKEAYVSAIAKAGVTFDIVIIDGIWRNESTNAALPYLKNGGLIILDNSDWYTDVAEFIRSHNFFQVDFSGFGPVNSYCWTTSLFLPLQSSFTKRFRQPRPIGGIEVSKGDTW
jgi:hypothetical protein